MGSRTLVFLAVLLLVTPALALAQASPPQQAPSIGLGYGPQSIEPASFGVPIFAPGDQLWVRSFENTSTLYAYLTASGPGGVPVVMSPTLYLQPGALGPVYTFSSSDAAGTWTLHVYASGGGPSSSTPVTLVNATSLVPSFVGANVTGNDLSLSYALPPTSAYNIQECTMGAIAASSVSFQLPSDIGEVLNVTLSKQGGSVSTPNAATPFSGWLELYTSRAYQNGEVLLSEETLAARSRGVFQLNNTSPVASVLFDRELTLRPGRYDLRAYVRTSSGLSSFDAPYMMLGGGAWVSLSGCTQLANVASSAVHLTANLDASNATWPRLLYTMYTVDGVDGVTASKVPVSEARIDIKNNATGGRLRGAGFQAEGAGIQYWSSSEGGVYVIAGVYPLNVKVTVDFEKVTSESFNVTVPEPFQHVTLRILAGALVVHTSADGNPLANATVEVSPQTARQVLFYPDAAGNVTITLPPGGYNVTASYSGKTRYGQAQVVPGGVAYVGINFVTQGVPPLLYLLAAALAAVVGVNFLVWRTYLERRSGDDGEASQGRRDLIEDRGKLLRA